MMRIIVQAVLLALIISLVGARPALAYIDPNTGGVLFQVLAILFASFSAILLVFSRQIRMAFARARRFLRSLLNRSPVIPLEKEASDDSR
jgi:hypothetical protein